MTALPASDVVPPLRARALDLATQGRYEDAFPLYKRILFEYGEQSSGILSEAGFVCRKLGVLDEIKRVRLH